MSRKIQKLLPAVALAMAASEACAQLLYDPINYSNGVQLDATAADANKNYSSSGTYWASRGSQAGLLTVSTGLGAPNNIGSAVLPPTSGNGALFPSVTTGRTAALGFGQTATSGDIYYSVMLKAPAGTLGATAGTFMGFSNFSIPTPNAPTVFQGALRYVNVDANTYNLGIASGGVTQINTDKDFTAGDTVFAVVRYTMVPGNSPANDQAAIWLNPQSGFGDNGAIPTPDFTVNHVSGDSVDAMPTPASMIAGFFARSFSSTAGFTFDEVRVDNTWAGVTPDGTKQYTFNNASGGNWSDANTWNDYQNVATASNPNATGDVANFGSNITSLSTINVDGGGKTVDSINFNNAGNLTVSGDDLTVSSNASAGVINVSSGNHTIGSDVTMSSNLSVKVQSGSSVTLGGTVSGAGKTLGVYGNGTGAVKLGANERVDDTARLEVRSGTLDLSGFSETVDVLQLGTGHPNNGTAISNGTLYNGDLASGSISNGTITANSYDLQSGTISATLAGTNGVTKNLSGIVTLSGNNTYTGTTTVNSGELILSGTNSNPVTAVINVPPSVVGATATLALTSDASLGASGATVGISSTAGISGTLQFNETMTLASDRTITASAVASRLAVESGNTATVNALITGTGGINVTMPFDPTVANSGGTAALATTSGVLVLNNTANNYSGTTTVSGTNNQSVARILFPNKNVAPGFGVAAQWVANAGGILSVPIGGPGDWAEADILTLRNTATFAATNSFVGFDTTNATGGAYTYTTDFTGNAGVSKHGTGTLTLPGLLNQSGGVNASGGTLVLTNANSYSGQTLIDNGGVLRIANSGALGATGASPANTFVRGGGGVNAHSTLQLDGSGGDLSVAESIVIEGKSSSGSGIATGSVDNVAGNNTITGTISFDAGGTWYNLTSTAGKLNVATVTNALGGATVRQLNLRGAGDGEITGGYTNTGCATDVRVAKFDSGTWTLSGTNTYNGTTTVNAGRLQVTQTAALPGFATAGKVVVNNTGTLGLNVGGGGEWTSGDIDSLKAAATFNAGSVLALDSTNAAGTFTHASDVSGLHGVAKLGTGTVALTGNNSYTGGTNVAAGTLEVKRMHAGNAVTVAAGATLRVQESSPGYGSGFPSGDNAAVSQPSSLTVNPAGFLDITNNDIVIDYTGSSPVAAYEALVASAYNITGDWAGPGITSSIAAIDGNYIVAIADNATLAAPFGTAQGGPLFSGVDVDLDTILIKFTHRADINLDGLITPDDSAIFGGNYDENQPATWATGDMNYDGIYTPDDAAIFGGAYDESLSSLPEPASIGALGLAASLLVRRRRAAKPA